MWRSLLVCLLGGCGFQLAVGDTAGDDQAPTDGEVPDGDASPPHWLTGYTHRKKLVVASGQTITLDNFAVAIILPDDPDLAAHARDDGQDITITTASDTILDYELESFDGGSGAMTMWVRVPALESQTTLFMYYGGEIRQHDPRTTWDPATFRAVWHLTDAAGTQAHDSASTHDLSSSGTQNQPTKRDGIAGAARGFDGLNDMLRDDGDDDTLDFGVASFSYSAWVYVEMSAGVFDMPMYKGGAFAAQAGFDIELGMDNWSMYIGDGATNRAVTVGNETLNAWTNITIVVDRASQQLRGFMNAVEMQKLDISDIGSTSSGSTFVLGSNGSAYWFRGRIDEARVYARALSPEWIAAEYGNLTSPATFVTRAAEEAAP